jgi:hypothetical protein
VLLYPTVKVVHLILAKNGVGYILGEFFINSSGHPGFVQQKSISVTILGFALGSVEGRVAIQVNFFNPVFYKLIDYLLHLEWTL